MKLGAVDVEFTTRVLTLPEAWTFVMEKLEGLEVLTVEITAQEWRAEDDAEWTDTFKVAVCGRQPERVGQADG